MRLFLIAAIVLIVLAIIATAVGGVCLGVEWESWACAALLAFFVDLLWPVAVGSGGVVRRPGVPPTV